jgi:membrane protein DedA with SNARE-associated domain
MQEIIIEIMNQFGYLGVAVLIMIENLFPPIPSEVILTFGGFMTTYSRLGLLEMVLASTIGSVLGALILYFIGRMLSTERLEKLIAGRLGKLLRLKTGDIKKAENWFMKRGKSTIFFCRFIPLIRSLISIPAGSAKMKLPIFLSLTTLGTLIWNLVLVFLGAQLGENWEIVAGIFDSYSSLVVLIFGGIFLISFGIFIKKRFFTKTKTA